MATKVKKRIPHKNHGATVASALKQRKELNFKVWNAARNQTLDFVVIALGRMGFRATKFKEFNDHLAEVWKDYAELLVEVKKDDPELWEAKAKIDRELKLYVGEQLFVPYDERHSDSEGY